MPQVYWAVFEIPITRLTLTLSEKMTEKRFFVHSIDVRFSLTDFSTPMSRSFTLLWNVFLSEQPDADRSLSRATRPSKMMMDRCKEGR